MPRRKLFPIAGLAAMAMLWLAPTHGAKPRDEMLELYGVFVDAVEQVEANYVRPVPRKELLENALKGMLLSLDPHSTYFTQAEWTQFLKEIGESFTGIGVSIEIDPDTKRLRVLSPLPGSPAYAAGILPGDIIIEIDGKSTEGMNRDQAIEALQGRPGTQVTLKVVHLRSREPVDLTLTRQIIQPPSVVGDVRKADDQWDFLIAQDPKIGYVRITNFIQETPDEVKKAVEELTAQGAKGLVIDLRDNSGGLLSAAVAIADLFLKEGKIVTTKGRNQRDQSYEAEEEGTVDGLPIVVLVNQFSASASEILAAALQDHKRAVVVGQRSYGKGSVQHSLPLDNGQSVLKLTVATYWRPSGKNIHRFAGALPTDEWGVSPDEGMEVKWTPEEYVQWAQARRKRDLIAHGLDPDAAKEAAPPRPKDTQLDKALEVLRGKIAG
jgi:carboxyl-terminal processing protease